MRKVGIIGAAIILASSVGVAFGQERAPQHVGYGTGVGDSQGVGDRSRVMDQGDMLRYLSAPETVMGEVVAVNPQMASCISTWVEAPMMNVRALQDH